MTLLVQLLLQRSVKVNPTYLGIRPPENWSKFEVKIESCEKVGNSGEAKKLPPGYIFQSKQIRLLKVQPLTDIVHAIPENVITQVFEKKIII